MNQENYIKELEHNLAVLQGYGVHYVNNISAVIDLLQQYRQGKIDLTSEQIDSLYDISRRTTKEHLLMLRMKNEERMTYSHEDD